MTTISVERDEATAVVELRSDDGLNVATVPGLTALRDALAGLATDTGIGAVVLTGGGDRAFCAGADIKYMSGIDADEAAAWGRLGHATGRLLEEMPKVTIAAINGLAIGGGCELALACDLRYASSSARLGQPEVNLGLIPGWGGTQRLARTAGLGFAKELLLTGRLVDSAEALARGLVNGVHDPVLEKAREVADTVLERGPMAVAAAKALVNTALQGDHQANLAREGAVLGELLVGDEAREGLAAFLDKRAPGFSRAPEAGRR